MGDPCIFKIQGVDTVPMDISAILVGLNQKELEEVVRNTGALEDKIKN